MSSHRTNTKKAEDTNDALGFNIFKGSKKDREKSNIVPESTDSSAITTIDKDADIYDMTYARRGTAIIFNHNTFDDRYLNPRKGTTKDGEDLKRVLTNLEFEVKLYNDLKYADLFEVLQKTAAMDHSNSSCILIAVMSHGDKNEIHARDHSYEPDTLWNPFSGKKCPTLAGKPKLFFIQACRGTDVDDGVKIRERRVTTDASAVSSYTIPAMADILVMYSSFDGYYSWRNPISGSWFIQCLCKELEEKSKTKDILTVLTFVNRRMAVDHESHVPGKYDLDRKKQVGSINTTFTRMLYFYPEIYVKTK